MKLILTLVMMIIICGVIGYLLLLPFRLIGMWMKNIKLKNELLRNELVRNQLKGEERSRRRKNVFHLVEGRK